MGTMGSMPYLMRRVEQRFFSKQGPYPSDWTMRTDEIASFARPNALEKDVWARKRARLDNDVWAAQRKGDIDAEREKRDLFGDPDRRSKILSSTWGQREVSKRDIARWDESEIQREVRAATRRGGA